MSDQDIGATGHGPYKLRADDAVGGEVYNLCGHPHSERLLTSLKEGNAESAKSADEYGCPACDFFPKFGDEYAFSPENEYSRRARRAA